MMSMTPDRADEETTKSDLHVVRQVVAGDMDAFEVLLRRYSRAVFATVARRVPVDEVEVVAQETFVSAFRSLGAYEPDQPFLHWLLRIARRRCVDYWRQRGRSREIPAASLSAEHIRQLEDAAEVRSQETELQARRRENAAEIVQQALAGLDPEDRLLIECMQVAIGTQAPSAGAGQGDTTNPFAPRFPRRGGQGGAGARGPREGGAGQ
jgi:RNA polymerase sigma-70 factor, ECF subfamily